MNADYSEVQAQGPIHRQIDKIEKNTKRVSELVGQLRYRLDVILSPSAPQAVCEDKKQRSEIALVSRLSNINDVTIETRERLDDIVSRLAL